jgi:hypothetical protein
MNRGERWLVHLSNLTVIVTGLAYAVMKYLLEPADPFAVINHPLQPLTLTLHLLAAPLLVLAVGILWKGHIAPQWRSGRPAGKVSGIGLGLTFLPMVLSGYLLQTASAPFWRQAWLAVHLATSAVWLLMFIAHQASFITRRLRWRRQAARVRRAALSSPAGSHPGEADREHREKPAA